MSKTPPSPAKAGTSSPQQKSPSPPGVSSPSGILPARHWTQNPVEPDDAESAFGDSSYLSTASITSSILNYRTLHGRRYHSDIGNAKYWASNDEKQNESMDINHHTLTLVCGNKLHLAPLDKDKLQKAVDIGTGTGLWAIDFADEFPTTEVIGTDISPIQSTWIPPNLKFEIEDFTREWTFPESSLDYIHMRWLIGSIRDWTAFFAEAYKACRPGGWVESLEGSCFVVSDHCDLPDSSALGQWSKFFVEGGKKLGSTFLVIEEDLQRKGMEAAGFIDIQEAYFKRPLGTWPQDPIQKEAGTMAQMVLESDTEGYILFVANTLGWTREEIQVYIAHLRREIRSNQYCPHSVQKVVWGRKPE